MKKIMILTLIILALLIISGCKQKYVCADGSIVESSDRCPYNQVAIVRELDARKYADNFVSGYLRHTDYSHTLVNTYMEQGNFITNFVISSRAGTRYESRIKVHGITGTPECIEGCFFMENPETNSTNI
jgi:hypothetical protein